MKNFYLRARTQLKLYNYIQVQQFDIHVLLFAVKTLIIIATKKQLKVFNLALFSRLACSTSRRLALSTVYVSLKTKVQ